MAGGRTAICACQQQDSPKAKHLQHRLQQRAGSTEGININQIKEMPTEISPGQQLICRRCADLSRKGCRLQVRFQESPSIGICIIDMQLHRSTTRCLGFKPPAHGPDAAAGHEIKPSQRPKGLASLKPRKQNRKIPGGSGFRSKES